MILFLLFTYTDIFCCADRVIIVMAEDIPVDKTFKDLGVCDQLVEACESLGWKNPSKIQAEAIPHALDGSFSCFRSLSSHCVLVSMYFFVSSI